MRIFFISPVKILNSEYQCKNIRFHLFLIDLVKVSAVFFLIGFFFYQVTFC